MGRQKALAHDEDQRQADMIQQEVHIKWIDLAIEQDLAVIDAVDDHAVELGDLKLEHIDDQQRQNAKQKPTAVSQIIAVDMLTEYHNKLTSVRKITRPCSRAH